MSTKLQLILGCSSLSLISMWSTWTRRRYRDSGHPPRWLDRMEAMRCYLADEDPPLRSENAS